jgi:hypothetical protein
MMDAQIAATLEREGYQTPGLVHPITSKIVCHLRARWKIPTVKLNNNQQNPAQWEDGSYSVFERDRLPSRSALSRFLAALTEAPVEALRTLFLDDLLARPLTLDKQTGGLVDRAGNAWVVFDIDGTREAARQRALPQTDELPSSFRRLDDVCAPG